MRTAVLVGKMYLLPWSANIIHLVGIAIDKSILTRTPTES